jgi:hypothetical protein
VALSGTAEEAAEKLGKAAKSSPRALKRDTFSTTYGTKKQAAEKVNFGCPAPKGASDFEGLTVSLKRYPDTKPDFSRSL